MYFSGDWSVQRFSKVFTKDMVVLSSYHHLLETRTSITPLWSFPFLFYNVKAQDGEIYERVQLARELDKLLDEIRELRAAADATFIKDDNRPSYLLIVEYLKEAQRTPVS